MSDAASKHPCTDPPLQATPNIDGPSISEAEYAEHVSEIKVSGISCAFTVNKVPLCIYMYVDI